MENTLSLVVFSFFSFCSIFAIVEGLGINTFVRFFYKIGITIFVKDIILNKPLITRKLNDSIYMDEGKFQFKDDNKVYFVSRDWGLSRFFRLSTPFSYKGIAEIINDKNIKIYGKLPLGITIITLSFLIPIVVLDISNLLYNFDFNTFGVTTLIIFIFIFCLYIEKRRMNKMVNELVEILQNKECVTL